MDAFIGGLHDELQYEMLAISPDSLTRAMELAQLFENPVQPRKGLHSRYSPLNHVQFSLVFRPQYVPHTPTTLPGPSSKLTHSPMYCRISQAEFQSRNEKSLCIYYLQKYQPGHFCTITLALTYSLNPFHWR